MSNATNFVFHADGMMQFLTILDPEADPLTEAQKSYPGVTTVRPISTDEMMQMFAAEVAKVVPETVSAFQFRTALHSLGLYEKALEAISASSDGSVKIAWEYATTFDRPSSFVASLAKMLGLNKTAVDDLFRTAAKIT